MDVRMRASEGVAAVLTGAARLRLRTGAEQALAEPEREPLLADAERSMQQQRSRKRVAADGIVQPGAERGVTVKREKGHA